MQQSVQQEPEQDQDGGPSPGYQRIMRIATGVILASFVLVVLATTVSTGPFVQALGKGLYYAIVASAAVMLVAWLHHRRMVRRRQ